MASPSNKANIKGSAPIPTVPKAAHALHLRYFTRCGSSQETAHSPNPQ
ncbi:hypothetical protein IAG44_19810 [Streptomyces roseirectus]|uniref:Uncharacterized protein n=1 Tax=Streptomyces roseirectus TaxID=2768066 RepID=A0A7H0IF94_9ACTN|nr:hypothetical protein IAG44_19810 [Streptomyces roseirectus]